MARTYDRSIRSIQDIIDTIKAEIALLEEIVKQSRQPKEEPIFMGTRKAVLEARTRES
jgi:hypothetical protein